MTASFTGWPSMPVTTPSMAVICANDVKARNKTPAQLAARLRNFIEPPNSGVACIKFQYSVSVFIIPRTGLQGKKAPLGRRAPAFLDPPAKACATYCANVSHFAVNPAGITYRGFVVGNKNVPTLQYSRPRPR